jgi:predicted transcriptional regulator
MIDPIKELRKRQLQEGFNQAELAEEIGVSSPFLCLVLAGKKSPGPKILEYLEMSEVKRYERISTDSAGSIGKDRKRSARAGNGS